MLEKVKAALVSYHEEMQKADQKKTSELDKLAAQFQVKSRKGINYVPNKVKETDAYNNEYVSILSEHETTARQLTTKYQSEATDELAKVKADIVVSLTKAPDEKTLNSIKAVEMLNKGNLQSDEIYMLMENCRNYLACRDLAQISEKTEKPIKIVTMQEIFECLNDCENIVNDYFRFYNPLNYKTMSIISSDKNWLGLYDEVLTKVSQGNFVKPPYSKDFEKFYDIKSDYQKRKDAEKAAAAERFERIEKKVEEMTEAEKLAMYLKN